MSITNGLRVGNVLMLSKGNKAVDDMFTLQDGNTTPLPCIPLRTDCETGTLTMYLGKETYEKAGLVGKPYGAKGNRKTKPRWGTLRSNTLQLRHGTFLTDSQLSHTTFRVLRCCTARGDSIDWSMPASKSSISP